MILPPLLRNLETRMSEQITGNTPPTLARAEHTPSEDLRQEDLDAVKKLQTGFDNIKLSEFCYPALTTVHIPRDRIGHIAFECLAPDSLKTRPVGREILVDPEFVVRESTGPAPNN